MAGSGGAAQALMRLIGVAHIGAARGQRYGPRPQVDQPEGWIAAT